jgi:hypothetical protein
MRFVFRMLADRQHGEWHNVVMSDTLESGFWRHDVYVLDSA